MPSSKVGRRVAGFGAFRAPLAAVGGVAPLPAGARVPGAERVMRAGAPSLAGLAITAPAPDPAAGRASGCAPAPVLALVPAASARVGTAAAVGFAGFATFPAPTDLLPTEGVAARVVLPALALALLPAASVRVDAAAAVGFAGLDAFPAPADLPPTGGSAARVLPTLVLALLPAASARAGAAAAVGFAGLDAFPAPAALPPTEGVAARVLLPAFAESLEPVADFPDATEALVATDATGAGRATVALFAATFFFVVAMSGGSPWGGGRAGKAAGT